MSDWISVRDRLPGKEHVHVLVWCTLWREEGELAIASKQECFWDVEGANVANQRVTHWMPMPEGPT